MRKDFVLLRYLAANRIDVVELLREFGGMQHYLPSLEAYRAQVRSLDMESDWGDGLNLEQIARKHGLSTRQVRRVIGRLRLGRKRAA